MSFGALFTLKALLILIAVSVVASIGVGLYAFAQPIPGEASQAGGGAATAVGLGIVPIAAWVLALAFALAFKRRWLMEVNLWVAAALAVIALTGLLSFFNPLSGPLAWFSGYGYSSLGGRFGDAVIGSPGFFGALRALAILALACVVALPSFMGDLGAIVGQWMMITFTTAFTGIGSMFSRKRGEDDANYYPGEEPYVLEPEESVLRRDYSSMRREMWGSEALVSNGEVIGLSDSGDEATAAEASWLYGRLGQAAYEDAIGDERNRLETESVGVGDTLTLQEVSNEANGDSNARATDRVSYNFLSASPDFLDDQLHGNLGRSTDDGNGATGNGRDVLSDVPVFPSSYSDSLRSERTLVEDAFADTAELVLSDEDDAEDAGPPWGAEPNGGDRFERGARAEGGPKLNQYWLPDGAGSPEPDPIRSRASRVAEGRRYSSRSTASAESGGSLWRRPGVELFKDAPENPISQVELDETASVITQTLADYNVEVEVGHVRPGPTVTMYGLVPGWVRRNRRVKQLDSTGSPILDARGRQTSKLVEEKTRVKVSAILQREADLALALKTPSLRIETPAMGKSLVGIEVPNPNPSMVAIRNVMSSNEFQKMRKTAQLPVALGRGSGGEAVCFDLAKMPHLLVAGATGSGKSVCLNAIVSCIITEKTPAQVRLLLVDPKRVELTPYNGIPHLMAPVVVETDTVVGYLKGLIREMFNRYRLMEESGVRNIEAYNERGPDKMPYLCVVVDELADLMMTAAFDVEQSLCRLAQLGRATGIHLIIATQRPSVDVVTGLIKANFPSRISFGVTSQVDSRTIIDTAGADKLLGRGDMLYLPLDASKPSRVQSVFIGDDEIGDLVNFWQKKPWPPLREIDLLGGDDFEGDDDDAGQSNNDPNRDDMLVKATELAQTHRKLSTSLLQRRLRIGYPRAARLMDQLEEEGIVGPADGAKSRDVIMNQT